MTEKNRKPRKNGLNFSVNTRRPRKRRHPMTTTTFDTLKFTEQLIEAGYSEQQAKGTVRAYQAANDGMELATKADIKELKSDMIALKYELVIKICGINFALMLTLAGFLAWFIENHGKV